MYTVSVRLHRCTSFFNVCVNLTGEEFAKLDKVVMNQTYGESKSRIMSTIVFQHATTIWPTATPDDVTMRTLGPWAVCQYRCNGAWMNGILSRLPCVRHLLKEVRLHLTKDKAVISREIALAMESQASKEGNAGDKPDDKNGTKPPTKASEMPSPEFGLPTKLEVASGAVGEDPRVKVLMDLGFTRTRAVKHLLDVGPPRNKLGYVELGFGNEDVHPLGGRNAEDSEIRADRQDRVVIKDAGIGIVGQSTDPLMGKQIVGCVGLPVSFGPNVYAKEAANIDVAIDQRITKKQRPFTATNADKELLGRFVREAIGHNPHRSLFSTKRITEWWEKTLFSDLRSGKWTESRLTNTVEGLCRRIEPTFKLSADIKLEGMPEGKAPRMLIADGDEGQVLALLTICCIEDLIKKHLPSKTIKGIGKRQAMQRVASELRVPKGALKKTKKSDWDKSKQPNKGCSVFEGDGSAWDTTCSAKLRDCVENPVIVHVASTLKALMSEPDAWVDSHTDVSVLEKITLTFKKNGEFRKFTIDAIRRSGHRGTSCLNWWINFTCWHCAIFEHPEIFLDPSVRYGRDHAGIMRWLASAFEGDDSILSTTPAIKESDEIYVSILQRWVRFGFNMEIFIRENKALFTGYKLAIDEDGPTGVIMPEVDRCFGRGGISCSSSMIQGFKDNDAKVCQSISKSAALSRAYEFAGLAPTISTKYLRYYESINVKTLVDRELVMRTTGELDNFNEPEIVADINMQNGAAMSFDNSERDRFAATGFECSEEELSLFTTRIWEYSLLHDWEGFRESLPQSWRAK